MDKKQLLERTVKELRSVLISAPRGVALRLLLNDFKVVLGHELPYRQLDFQRVEDFIKSVPHCVRVAPGANGELTCFAVADESTSQIARFVALQKKPKLKKSNAPPSVRKSAVLTAFTKKSNKYGPSSHARPRSSYNKNKFSGPGNVYTGGPRQAKPQYGKGYKSQNLNQNIAPRLHQQQQQQQTDPSRSAGSNFSSSSSGFSGSGTTISAGTSSVSTNVVLNGRLGPPGTTGTSNVNSSDKIGPNIKQSWSPPSSNAKGDARPEETARSKALPQRTGSHSCKKGWDTKRPRQPEVVSIVELAEKAKVDSFRNYQDKVIGVVGYVADEQRYDHATVKYLLYSDYDKRGKFPAVMLFFGEALWPIEDASLDLWTIPLGSKLKVYGQAIKIMSPKRGIFEPAIRVHHYSYETKAPPTPATTATTTGTATGSAVSGSKKPLPAPTEELKRHIYKLLKAKTSGVWGRRLKNEYKKIFEREAPEDIMDMAISLPFVKAEYVADDTPILFLVEEKEPPTSAPPSSAPPSSVHVEKPKVTFTAEKPPLPSTVEFPAKSKDGYSDVYVTYINNPISFYLQLSGELYADKMQAMNEALNAHMLKNSQVKPVTGVKENGLYAYSWEGDLESWCRVLVSSIAGNKVEVFFPDYGNSEEVSMGDLLELPGEFYELPFQAIHCCLHSCTGIQEKATETFIELAQDKSCVAQVMDSSGTRVAVELIDSESDSGETINALVMSALHPIETLYPRLPKPGTEHRVPVTLTDVDETGVLTVQLHGPGLSRLQHLMTAINEKYKKSRAADFVNTVTDGGIYCTQFPSDKKFYRVKVKKALPGKMLVEYVDYGNEDTTEIKKLRKPLNDPLFKLPPQAVKCVLHGAMEWSEDATHFMSVHLDCEDLYLTVVEAGTEGSLPSVQLTVSTGGEETDLLQELLLHLQELLLHQQEFANYNEETDDSFSDTPFDVDAEPENSISSIHSPMVDSPLPLFSPAKSESLPNSEPTTPVATFPNKDVIQDGAHRFGEITTGSSGSVNKLRTFTSSPSADVAANMLNSSGGSCIPTSNFVPTLPSGPNVTSLSANAAPYTPSQGSSPNVTPRTPSSSSPLDPNVIPQTPSSDSPLHPNVAPQTPTLSSASSPLNPSVIPRTPSSSSVTSPSIPNVTPRTPSSSSITSLNPNVTPYTPTLSPNATLYTPTFSPNVTPQTPTSNSSSYETPTSSLASNISTASNSHSSNYSSPFGGGPRDNEKQWQQAASLSSSQQSIEEVLSLSDMSVTSSSHPPSVAQNVSIGHDETSFRTSDFHTPSYQVASFQSPSFSTPLPMIPRTPSGTPSSCSSPARVPPPGSRDPSSGVEVRSPAISPLVLKKGLKFASFGTKNPEAVAVVFVASPQRFVIQLMANCPKLDALMDELNCRVEDLVMLDPKDVKPGLVCSAQSELDDMWYRALVLSAPGLDGNHIEVEFLDYGSTEVLINERIKPLPKEFVEYPFQAIFCTLRGVEPIASTVGEGHGVWSEAALKWFEETVMEKNFFALELTKAEGLSCISLLDTSSERTVDIREALKEAGFAKFEV